MRPIERGKNKKKFSDYPQARGDLIDRLGQYCSYCGMKLDASLAVEHVQPKDRHPKLRREWSNFLLACTNCNSTKGSKDIKLDNYVWPDTDNTFRAFIYSEGGRIAVNPELNRKQKRCAQNMLDLTGLQKYPGNDPEKKDRRWINRKKAWEYAARSLARIKKKDSKYMRAQVIEAAELCGYWSVWMTVFKNDADMLNRLIDAFKGTSKKCFDKEGRPIARKGGIV